MIRFECDYSEGAHPQILKKLELTNFEQTPGYGTDKYCEQARETIKKLCGKPEAYVQFIVGGTQTNSIVISSVLRPHQGAVCADSGHIAVHESGAVESGGHKVLVVPSNDGKITAADVERVYNEHWNDVNHEHMVQPGLVYISFPTENGTIYSKAELSALYNTCRKLSLPLYIDGARLGYGLMSSKCDLTLPELSGLCDVFYIGGTKQGFLFGEAVVFNNTELAKDFRYIIKQRGAMFAKGRLLGIQFETMLSDGLYFDLAKHADELALKLRSAFLDKGYKLLYDSYTNQQYPIIPDTELKRLSEKFAFSFWKKVDDTHSAVRFCTSWATSDADVDTLIADL